MKGRPYRITMAVLLSALMLAGGCQTAGQSAGAGAIGGAVLGGIIGNQSGRAAEGAAIGALVGAGIGWGIHKLRARQVRTAEDTAQEYEYEPEQGFKLDMRDGTDVAPDTVVPGDELTATAEYATLGAGEGVEVRETFQLKQDDELLKELYDDTVVRTDGTWQSPVKFEVPDKAPDGDYTVHQQVSAQNQTLARDTTFTVKTATAKREGEDRAYVVSMKTSPWYVVETNK